MLGGYLFTRTSVNSREGESRLIRQLPATRRRDATILGLDVFATFTDDLHKLAAWLLSCRIAAVATKSPGVYRIPLYQILKERGLRVCLVNARCDWWARSARTFLRFPEKRLGRQAHILGYQLILLLTQPS